MSFLHRHSSYQGNMGLNFLIRWKCSGLRFSLNYRLRWGSNVKLQKAGAVGGEGWVC